MNLEDLRAFEADTAKVVPGFQLAWKDESKAQKLLGWVMGLFNPLYLTRYTTTFCPKVWFPTKAYYEADPSMSFRTLAHERVHLLDTQKSPLWFRISYMAPQIFAAPLLLVGVVLAFLIGWWALVVFGLALACLAPWPAPGRVRLEQRGYAMTMAVIFWTNGYVPMTVRASIRSQFLEMAYFKMSWSPADIDKWLDQTEQALQAGTLSKEETYGAVLQFLRLRGKTQV